MVKSTVEGLKYEEPALYKSLEKWQRLILSTVFKVSEITGQDAEAVFQDIVLALVEVSNVKAVPLYRWRNKLWEMKRVFGKYALLKAPRNNKKDLYREAFAPVDEVTMVERCEFDSLVYAKAQQTCADILTLHFSVRHGYSKFAEVEKLVRVTTRRDGVRFEKKKVRNFKRQVRELSVSDPCLWSDKDRKEDFVLEDLTSQNAEADLITKEALGLVYASVTPEARQILRYLLKHPGAESLEISRELGMPRLVVREGSRFIRNAIHELAG